MGDKQKVSYYCYLLASVSFFISAVINFFSSDMRYLAVIHLCLAAVFLYLASTCKRDKSEK